MRNHEHLKYNNVFCAGNGEKLVHCFVSFQWHRSCMEMRPHPLANFLVNLVISLDKLDKIWVKFN